MYASGRKGVVKEGADNIASRQNPTGHEGLSEGFRGHQRSFPVTQSFGSVSSKICQVLTQNEKLKRTRGTRAALQVGSPAFICLTTV